LRIDHHAEYLRILLTFGDPLEGSEIDAPLRCRNRQGL
jgi:hypothetical protein